MSDEGVILDTEMKRNLLIQRIFVAFQSRRSTIPNHFCGETNQLGEGEKQGRFSVCPSSSFFWSLRQLFCYFSCVQTNTGLWISSGGRLSENAHLYPHILTIMATAPAPPILFYDNRLSGNGNKHFCLPTWLDSMSYDPVLSEHDPSRRQRGRQADW